MKSIMQNADTIIFVARRNFGDIKKGFQFDCFNGLVKGLMNIKTNQFISFDSKWHFKILKITKRSI